MDKYILRYLILGQLIIVGFLSFFGMPAEGYTYAESILKTVGVLVAIDVVGLTASYLIRRNDELLTVPEFLKSVW